MRPFVTCVLGVTLLAGGCGPLPTGELRLAPGDGSYEPGRAGWFLYPHAQGDLSTSTDLSLCVTAEGPVAITSVEFANSSSLTVRGWATGADRSVVADPETLRDLGLEPQPPGEGRVAALCNGSDHTVLAVEVEWSGKGNVAIGDGVTITYTDVDPDGPSRQRRAELVIDYFMVMCHTKSDCEGVTM